MRIVIEADENIAVETARRSTEPPDHVTRQFIDAGPAPLDLLRRLGHAPPNEAEARGLAPREAAPQSMAAEAEKGEVEAKPKSAGARRALRDGAKTPLNPLRAGAAVARGSRKPVAAKMDRAEGIETTDAGSAPKISRRKTKR